MTDADVTATHGPANRVQAMDEAMTMALEDGALLVFGMRWFPLVGSRPAALARRRARAARATHYVHGGTRAAAVGCTRLSGRLRPCHSAAQAFAQSYPQGTAAGLLMLDDGRAWLVATQDGAVMTRTDRIHPNREEALATLAGLEQFYPGLSASLHTLEVATLVANAGVATTLWRLSPWLSLPAAATRGAGAFRAGLLVVGFSVLGWQAWRLWGPAATQVTGPADPLIAWHAALRRQADALRVHDAAWLGRAFVSLRRLPAEVRGWGLESARCVPLAHAWRCEARYRRASLQGSNEGFAAMPPAHERAHFDGPHFEGLTHARVSWQVAAGQGGGVDPARLDRRQAGDIRLGSLLQRLLPVFGRIALGSATALPLTAPLDAAGRPLPRPQGIATLYARALSLHGPLRSYALLQAPPGTIAWREISLTLTPGHRAEAAGSVLTARLEGVVYERE